MTKVNQTKHKLSILLFTIFLITIISISGFAVYAMQSVSIPLEVKEPLEIIEYPKGFSLYVGETVNFDFTVENHASTVIFQEFDFTLNDTNYQNKYVTFSNHNYSIQPGINKLQAWLTIASNAPKENFIITINKKTTTPTPIPSPTPTSIPTSNITLNPTLELLAGGIKWATQEGKTALYINWKDNWQAHYSTDGSNWEYRSKTKMDSYQNTILPILEDLGLKITMAGNFPENLTSYDIVVIHAYYAIEPQNEPLIRNYVNNGGSVVLLYGAPIYFTGYSKTMASPGESLESVEEWFGASTYFNTGGSARVAFDNPFGTSLFTSDILMTGIYGNAAIKSLDNDAEAIAFWDSGEVFAFTHEYGAGRVYYQAAFKCL